MNGFERNDQFLSLCGLNCGLCPMFIGKYYPGCGGDEGNQSCRIARCGIEHGCTEYCFRCAEYPCGKYGHIDEYYSFITHRNQKSDLEKARRIGIDSSNEEQKEKAQILERLLIEYNDGRKNPCSARQSTFWRCPICARSSGKLAAPRTWGIKKRAHTLPE